MWAKPRVQNTTTARSSVNLNCTGQLTPQSENKSLTLSHYIRYCFSALNLQRFHSTPYTEFAAIFTVLASLFLCKGLSRRRGHVRDRHQPDSSYLLRKLHSLTGVIPVGAFLAEHFWSNSAALVSAQKYNQTSEDLQTIPYRVFVEWLFIFLPILYHGGYGVYIWLRGQSNVSQYPWVRNWLYTLQRWTGLIAFVYIGWHLYTERWITHGRSTYATVANDLQNPWYLAFFVIGVLASSFHLGRRHLEFSLQVGTRRHCSRATRRWTARRFDRSSIQRCRSFDNSQFSTGLAPVRFVLTEMNQP